jgi:hypothetical protein
MCMCVPPGRIGEDHRRLMLDPPAAILAPERAQHHDEAVGAFDGKILAEHAVGAERLGTAHVEADLAARARVALAHGHVELPRTPPAGEMLGLGHAVEHQVARRGEDAFDRHLQ